MHIELPPRSFAGLIFDCDGTLVDSMPLHHRAWRAAFAEHGATFDFGWELFMSRAGMGLAQTVQELNVQFGARLDPTSVVLAQHRHYEQLLPEVEPVEPVVRWVRHFAGKLPMSVASGGDKRVVTRTLEVVGLSGLFDHVVCQVDVAHGKPAPDMFLRCAELMGVQPAECLVFEDGEPGIEAARRAGMSWVAVDGSGRRSA